MIGENVEFKSNKTEWRDGGNRSIKACGKVMDKISEIHTDVARGWAMSKGSNNVAVSETVTYYMIADKNGKMHRVSPEKILRII